MAGWTDMPFFGSKAGELWLFLLGVVLSAVLLGMLIVQLVREHQRKHPRDGKKVLRHFFGHFRQTPLRSARICGMLNQRFLFRKR